MKLEIGGLMAIWLF